MNEPTAEGGATDAVEAAKKAEFKTLLDQALLDPDSVLDMSEAALDDFLERMRVETEKAETALSNATEKGREKRASLAHKVSRAKTAVENKGKDRTKGMRDAIAAINEVRNKVVSRMEDLRDAIRAPLDEWKKQEESRIESTQAVIQEIVDAGYITPGASAADLKAKLKWVEDRDTSEGAMQEFFGLATGKKESTIGYLKAAIAAAEKAEADAAELARLRAESDAREAAARKEFEAREAELAELRREKAEREEADAARKAEEEAEANRAAEAKREHARKLIEHIKQCGFGFIGGAPQPPILLRRELDEKIEYTAEVFGELLGEAEAARKESHARLDRAEEAARVRRQQEAEEAERVAAEAVKQAKAEADAAVEAERQRLREEAAEAERQREEAARQKREEDEARARNAQHRAAIIGDAVDDLMAARKMPNLPPSPWPPRSPTVRFATPRWSFRPWLKTRPTPSRTCFTPRT